MWPRAAKASPTEKGGYDFDPVTEYKEGLSKPLWQVIERIHLLGYTMAYAKLEFEYLSHFNSFDTDKFSFDQLAEGLSTIDVNTISADYGDGEVFGKMFRRYLFDKLGLNKIVDEVHYVKFHVGEAMENLSAYTVLQLLARNPSAGQLPVNWQFADVAENGWAQRSEFVRPLDASNRFLIVRPQPSREPRGGRGFPYFDRPQPIEKARFRKINASKR
jgi:HEPN/Toprim N-terminal domain 1